MLTSMLGSRMLDMFKRDTDPEEHNYLYAIPAAAAITAYGAGHILGELTNFLIY